MSRSYLLHAERTAEPPPNVALLAQQSREGRTFMRTYGNQHSMNLPEVLLHAIESSSYYTNKLM